MTTHDLKRKTYNLYAWAFVALYVSILFSLYA